MISFAVLALVGVVVGALWMLRTAKPVSQDAATTPESTPAPILTARSPRTESTVLLTPEVSQRLAAALAERGTSLVDLQDAALAIADLGFPTLDRGRLDELGRLYLEAYGRLSASERTAIERYIRFARWGVTESEADVAAGRRLFASAVMAMSPASRQRLQTLLGEAVDAGLLEQLQRRQRAGQVTEYTLPTPPSSSDSRQPAADSKGAPQSPAATTSETAAPDSEQRGEAYWRKRMQEARERVAKAEKEVAAREAQGISPFIEQQAPQAAALEKAKAELEAARKAVADLEEEARRAGALPGWLR